MRKEKFFLLVEDDESDIHIFQRAHKKLGLTHPVVVADDAESALGFLSKTERSREALVVLDIKMPRMDGFEFLKRLRGTQENHAHCVFVLSSSDSESDIENAYNLGASGYFVKNQRFDKTLAALKLMDDFISLAELPVNKSAASAH